MLFDYGKGQALAWFSRGGSCLCKFWCNKEWLRCGLLHIWRKLFNCAEQSMSRLICAIAKFAQTSWEETRFAPDDITDKVNCVLLPEPCLGSLTEASFLVLRCETTEVCSNSMKKLCQLCQTNVLKAPKSSWQLLFRTITDNIEQCLVRHQYTQPSQQVQNPH